MELNIQLKRVLSILVREYIRHGEPIGSNTLSQTHTIKLAASTVRKILHELEEAGYLRQNHKSGGRIPTDLAYRYYVDEYVVPHFEERKTKIKSRNTSFSIAAGSTEDVFNQLTSLLASKSKQVVLFFRADSSGEPLVRLNIILREGQALMYVNTYADGETHTSIIETDYRPNKDEVLSAERTLNERFEGLTVSQIRVGFDERVKNLPPSKHRLIDETRNHIDDIFPIRSKALITIGGIHNLISYINVLSPSHLEGIMSYMDQRDALRELLSCREKDRYQVTIGTENPPIELETCSLVTYPMNKSSHRAVIGILGPTRMPYDKILTLLEEIGEGDYGGEVRAGKYHQSYKAISQIDKSAPKRV